MQLQTWKKRTFIAFASAFEYYDIAIYAALQIYLAHHFFPESIVGTYSTILIWLPYLARYFATPIGGFFIGLYAEKNGRKAALIVSSWLTGLTALSMACLPTFDMIGYWAPILLCIFQIMQSFTYGGEMPTTTVYLIENSRLKEQIRSCSILVACNISVVSMCFILVNLCEAFLTEQQMLDFGWRIPLFFGALNIMVGFIIRRRFVESASFKKSSTMKIDPFVTFKILCFFAPNTILFYMSTMASKTLVNQVTQDPTLRSGLPILLTLLSALSCLVAGYWVDKQKNAGLILKKAYIAMFFLAVPVFYLQSLDSLSALIISELLILIVFGLSMAITFPAMYHQINENNKILTFGLAINIGVVILGGTTPLMVSFLDQFGHAYVGLMLSLGSLLYFLSLAIDKYQVNKTVSVMAKA